MKNTLLAVLIIAALSPIFASGAEVLSHALPKDATLILPNDTGISTGWAITPGMLKKLKDKTMSFSVAPNGKICLAGSRAFYYPEIALILTSQVPVQEFIWLAEGNMLVHSGQALGFLNMEPKDKSGKPKDAKEPKGMLSFSPLFTLPYKHSRLFPGKGDFFYLVGRNDKENRNEISAWDLSGEKKAPAMPLYATDAPISAVAGSPEKTYFASGRGVFLLEKGATEGKLVYANAIEDIRDLVYRSDVGLFFTTAHSAGYIGEKEQFVFLAYPGVDLRLRGDALYVRFGTAGNGIMKIMGPEKFADIRLDHPK